MSIMILSAFAAKLSHSDTTEISVICSSAMINKMIRLKINYGRMTNIHVFEEIHVDSTCS